MALITTTEALWCGLNTKRSQNVWRDRFGRRRAIHQIMNFQKHYEENPELYGDKPAESGKNIDGGPAVDHNKKFKEEIAMHRHIRYGTDAKLTPTQTNND